MAKIWKYKLSLDSKTELEIPGLYDEDEEGYIYKPHLQILHFGLQGDTPTIWAKVDPDAPRQKLVIHLLGTGFDCPEGKYIGTILMFNGNLALHAFADIN